MYEDVDGLGQGFVVHVFDASHTEDVRDFVWVNEHGCGAVGDDGLGEAGDGEHARFDVHVTVAKAREDVTAIGVDDFGVVADAMGGVRAAVGKAA